MPVADVYLPVGPRDTKVTFPVGRNPKLPDIYRAYDHPRHHGSGSAYYFIYEGTLKDAMDIYKLEVDELQIPQGPREDAISLGFLELLPGDIMFSRLSTDPSSGGEDVAVCWVTGEGIYAPELREKALLARDAALGDKQYRSGSHPEPDALTGEMRGGTAWERSLKTKFDEGSGRCYPFGCTFQKPRALYSPCAAGKLSVANEATLKMRSDLTEVVLEMAMISLNQGPREITEAIRVNHELFNTPSVGHPDNFAFTSNQLNLAHMRKWDSNESLAANMGEQFGGAHIDQLDSPGHYTNMIAVSDLPDDADPGRFFIVYPGIFCTLANFVSVNFSGLRVHGGSPPIASQSTSAKALRWATRCTIVSYAKIGPTSSEHKMPLLQIDRDPDNIISITPEMLRPQKFFLEKKKDAANFLVEGPTIMKPSSLMAFLARCFLILMLSLVSQLPSQMDVQIDSDSFLNSFAFVDSDGVRRRVGPWIDGPGWRRRTHTSALESQEARLQEMRKTWSDHQKKFGGHIPSAVCCLPEIAPLKGWPENRPLEKITPLLFKNSKGKRVDRDHYDAVDATASTSLKKKKKKKKNKRGGKGTGKGNNSNQQNVDDPPSDRRDEVLSSALEPESEEETVPAYTMRTAPNVVGGRGLASEHCLARPMSSNAVVHSPARPSLGPDMEDDASSVSSLLNALLQDAGSSQSPEPDLPQHQDSAPLSVMSDDEGDDVPLSLENRLRSSMGNRTFSDVCSLGKHPLSSDDGLSNEEGMSNDEFFDLRSGNMGRKRVRLTQTQTELSSSPSVLSTDSVPDLSVIHQQAINDDMPELELCGGGLAGLQICMVECQEIPQQSPSRVGQSSTQARRSVTPEESRSSSEVDNLRELPLYLRGLTSAVIHKELQRVRADVTALATHRIKMDANQAFDGVAKFQEVVNSAPLSVDSAAVIQSTWNSLEFLDLMTSKVMLRTRHFRSCIMTIQGASWNWLLSTIPAAVSTIYHHGNPDFCYWLYNLMQSIRVHALALTTKALFFPFHYGLVDIKTTRPAVLNFDDFVAPHVMNADAWIAFLTESVQEILKIWLDFPADGNSMWKGLFSINIIRTLGPKFLLLEAVWNKYKSATSRLMASTLLPEQLDVSRYPLLDPASSLRKNVERISQVVEDYTDGRLYRYVDVLGEGPSTFDYASEALRLESEERIVEFKLYMQDCFRLLFRREPIENTRLSELLARDQDRYSPFRERAPTRLNMLRPDGPFSRKNLRTLAGLFGALMCRGVSFGTLLSRKGQTVFRSPAEFEAVIANYENKKDCCDPCAYGTSNSLRSPDLAQPYWKSIQENDWPGLQKGAVLSFEDMYRYFYPRPTKPRFLGLGPLGSYLLTVDYAYAGLVKFPSPEEMGRVVFKLNKGPARVLAYLGFVSSDSAGKYSQNSRQREDDFANAFVIANKLVEDSIPVMYHEEAGLDVFVTEHSLCKFGRAIYNGAGSD